MDFTQYMNTDTENIQDTAGTAQEKDVRMQSFDDILTDAGTVEDTVHDLSAEDAAAFIRRISGTDENGKPKCTVSYGGYCFKDGDTENAVTDEACTGFLKNAYVRLIPNRLLPDFYEMDIVFESPYDTGLRLLWLKMEHYRLMDLKENNNNINVFYFNIMENFDEDREDLNGLIVCNVINPMLSYLTRVSPSQEAAEISMKDDTKMGGNIVRMLVHASMVSFEVTQNIDSAKLRSEVADAVREEMLEEEYDKMRSSMEEDAQIWDDYEDSEDDYSENDFSLDGNLNENLMEDMAGEED